MKQRQRHPHQTFPFVNRPTLAEADADFAFALRLFDGSATPEDRERQRKVLAKLRARMTVLP